MARKVKKPKYNEQFFRSMGGPGPTLLGALAVLVIIFGLYLAFAKRLPFTDPGYELNATFSNAANIRTTSPVRIAGVNVGEVTEVGRDGENATVTFTVSEEGLPIHEDATAQIRPRIFLEGNFFIDLDPGSPSSPEMAEDGTIPVTRTSTSVQLDEILTSLQSDSRENLEALLSGFGTALSYQPLPPDDVDQDPDVQGESAATALNDTWDYGGEAGRTTAQVNEALLGTQPHDLSKLLAAGDRVFSQLASREEQLKGLISNFNDFTGALASQSTALSETIALLEPTLHTTRRSLVNLNLALPPLRGYAIALQPAVRELPATIEAGLPWLAQAYPLLSGRELGGVANELAEGTPGAAASIQETLLLLPELTEFNRCVDENLIPTGNVVLEDRFGPYNFSSGVQNYKEFFHAAVNIAGETQDFDGNGVYVRLQPGGGPVAVRDNNPIGGFEAKALYGNTIAQPLGTRPAWTPKPPIRSDVPCYQSDRPNLNGPAAAVGPPSPQAYGTNQNPSTP